MINATSPLLLYPLVYRSQDSQNLLHKKAYRGYSHPAAESHEDRFSSGFYQFHKIGVKSNSRHGHDNKKLAQFFNRRRYRTWKRKHGSDHRGQDEEQDKKGEDLFYLEGSFGFLSCFLSFPNLPESQDQSNGDDRQSPGQFYDRCRVQSIASMYAVPRRSRRSYRRGVIYSGSRKKAKSFIAQSQDSSREGKIKAAITLKRKITEIAWAISSSSASITGAVAAMADPPQIQDPTPTRVEILLSIFSTLYITKAITRAVVIVVRIIGSDCFPFSSMSVRFMPNPRRITAYWRIFLEVYFTPGSRAGCSFKRRARHIPMRMAKTGPPTTGSHLPKSQAGTAISRQKPIPKACFF